MTGLQPSGYFVWCPDGNSPTVQHRSVTEAIREAERLARNNPGKQFIVLHALGSAMTIKPGEFQLAPGVDIDNHIPF